MWLQKLQNKQRNNSFTQSQPSLTRMMDDFYLKLADQESHSRIATLDQLLNKSSVCSLQKFDVVSIQIATQHPVIVRAAFLSATDSQRQ